MKCLRTPVILFVLLASSFFAKSKLGQAGESVYDHEVGLLDAIPIKTDAKTLIAYLGKLSQNEGDLAQIPELMRQLASDDADRRDAANQKLIHLGPAALPALRIAEAGKDARLADHARRCLRKIENAYDWVPQRAAVRVLMRHMDQAGLQAVLRFLPYTADEQLTEDIWFGVYQLLYKQPSLRAVMLTYLKDAIPARRALAGCVLARLGDGAQRQAARALLMDADPTVRLRTAQGLLGVKDASGVPALIELLREPALEHCWSAEELLVWLAGDEVPAPKVGAASPESREKAATAWQAWWKHRNGQPDWAGLEKEGRRPGLLLVCDRGKALNWPTLVFSRVWLCGCDGKPRWQIDQLQITHACFTPSNSLLTSEFPRDFKTEKDRARKGITAFHVPTGQTRGFLTHLTIGEHFLLLPNGDICMAVSERYKLEGAWTNPLSNTNETNYIRSGALPIPPVQSKDASHSRLVRVLDNGTYDVQLRNGNRVKTGFWVENALEVNENEEAKIRVESPSCASYAAFGALNFGFAA